MFEAAELGSRIPKEQYEREVPKLRVDLLNAQFDLQATRIPVLLVIVGDDRAGCSEVVRLLHAWMDARYMTTRVFGAPTEAEKQRPRLWRYWRALPPAGQIGIFAGDWALDTLKDRLEQRIDDAAFDRRVAHIARFQETLADDGALVLKFWIHLPRKELKKRLKKAKAASSGPGVDPTDRELLTAYEQVMPLAQRILRKTDSAQAPWKIVESTDARHRSLTVARSILSALEARLSRAAEADAPQLTPAAVPDVGKARPAGSVLDAVDLSQALKRDLYKAELRALQARLRRLSLAARSQGVSSVLVFEGWDAAGKGGVIRRITGAMDVQDYRVVAFAAPTDEEKARHYLWRFWRQLPHAGQMLIFDRSWYGRVLVERVEDLARPEEWRRAYAELNAFEEQLVDHGMLLCKFWLHVDQGEQLRRFKEREQTPYKKYKLTDEDFRNRERWEAYERAVDEMVVRTSTELAPWNLVASNDKRFARIRVLETVCDGLARLTGET